MAILSTPRPKAKPVYFSLSIPQASRTFGWTIPPPSSSIDQPVFPQDGQPSPLHLGQVTSTSRDGSVNGKWWGRYLRFISSPNISLINVSKVDFRFAIDTFSSTTKHSNWWNIGEWVASTSSFLNTLPADTIFIGSFPSFITLICMLDVWGRRRISSSI